MTKMSQKKNFINSYIQWVMKKERTINRINKLIFKKKILYSTEVAIGLYIPALKIISVLLGIEYNYKIRNTVEQQSI
jgi:hypothetical protein